MSGTASSQQPDVSAWIGRKLERQDIIDERMIAEFKATLSPYIGRSSPLPPGIHWCLAPDMLTSDQLGRDGHPQLGIFLPDLGLQRRMWAGGELTFHGDFIPGDTVTKTSIIEDVAFKSGKSGKLGFVKVRHHYAVRGQVVIDERQDIVYREPSTATIGSAFLTEATSGLAAAADHWVIAPSSTLLFRYSAMTFNGHRIHYDQPYAREIEGYTGLVVHGPLQATLMLNLAISRKGGLPRRFNYRGLAPLTCDQPFKVTAFPSGDGGFDTSVVSAAGVVTMSGRID